MVFQLQITRPSSASTPWLVFDKQPTSSLASVRFKPATFRRVTPRKFSPSETVSLLKKPAIFAPLLQIFSQLLAGTVEAWNNGQIETVARTSGVFFLLIIGARVLNFVRECLSNEPFKVIKIKGDGRCLFRAIVRALYGGENEQQEADELRFRVAAELPRLRDSGALNLGVPVDVICEGSFDEHVKQIKNPQVWGGEVELLALPSIVGSPIQVYIPGSYQQPIQEYGRELRGKPICLLYDGKAHYDLLEPRKPVNRS